MTIGASSTLAEVAWEVCTALDRVGLEAVLTGGSAATFYAPAAYQSRDLDFIVFAGDPAGGAEKALFDLGYHVEGSHYAHAESELVVEFPRGPLAVGGHIIDRFSTLRGDGRILRVLTPTDCCKDRLAAFFHWSDRGALQQALAVAGARAGEIDFEDIARWSGAEGHAQPYGEFARLAGRDA